MSAYSRSRTVTCSPSRMPAFELSAVTFSKSTASEVTVSSRLDTFSSVSRAVMIFVVEAG